jgi:transposase-like protein
MKNSVSILEQFQSLPSAAQEVLLETLQHEFESKGQVLSIVREELKEKELKQPCPHCGSTQVYKRGFQKGNQMYSCIACKSWYSSTTGTTLHGIKRKEKWQGYLRLMQRGTSIKKSAKALGICIQTSFDWRHKILSSLSDKLPTKLSGTVECDEMELPLSNKGERNLSRPARKRSSDFKRNTASNDITTVQVVTAVSRDGNKYLKAVETKRLTGKQIQQAIGKKLAKDVVLITDEHPSYKGFAKTKKQLTHKTVLAKEHINRSNKNIHLQRVNNTHKQLRDFLDKFNGVSSKYLQNYLNWYVCEKEIKKSANQLKQWFWAILTSDIAYNTYLLFKQNAVNIRT